MVGQPQMTVTQTTVASQPVMVAPPPPTVTTTTTTMQFVPPQTYQRVTYQYAVPYNRRAEFVIPVGVDQRVANLFRQASKIFRTFDTNYSGTLSRKEFRKCMKYNAPHLNKFEIDRLYNLVDRDGNGRITEREFCEFWVYSHLTPPVAVAQPAVVY